MKFLHRFLLFFFLSFAIVPAFSQEHEISEYIRERMEEYGEFGHIAIDGQKLFSKVVLPEFYARRAFRRAWNNPKALEQAWQAITQADLEGLNPADYHLDEIRALKSEIQLSELPAPIQTAKLDILLTDAILMYASHLLFGKVDPVKLDANWNFEKNTYGTDTVYALQKSIDTYTVQETLESLLPTNNLYQGLRRQLVRYRLIARKGGWPKIEAGEETLRKGMDDGRVLTLRRRLYAEGFLPSAGARDYLPQSYFDEYLEEVVKNFQKAHGLEVDGAIGKSTLEVLNQPVETKIEKIRVNMERGRWVLKDLPENFILVNIAGFDLVLVKNRQEVWHTDVMVGKPYHKTPVFKAQMRYVVFNPTWTVPPGIMSGETLPRIRRDPNYLASQNMEIIDRSGNVVSPSSLNLANATMRNFPYSIRQTPGSHNALGQVKLIFPNTHNVYLHDTPSRNLFDRAERAFSHGCIRVKNPLVLAEKVLDDSVSFNQMAIQRIVQARNSRTVFLREPLDVLILYWTASINREGQVYFNKDIYQRDPELLRELDKPPLL
jgi:murein L,D-transpeptidase YcbB/YkuD